MEGDFYKCEEVAFSEGISSSVAMERWLPEPLVHVIFSIWSPNGTASN